MPIKHAEDPSLSARIWLASPRQRTCVVERSGTAPREEQAFRWRSLLSSARRSRAARRFGAGVMALGLLRVPVKAAFQHPVLAPRAASMAGSVLAAEKDSAALFQAPSASAGLERGELYFQYQQLNAGMEGTGSIGQGFATAGVPTRLGTLSLGVSDFRAEGLMSERQLALGFARPVTPWLNAGVTAKYLRHSFSAGSDPLAANDPVFRNGTSKGAFALDAGAEAKVGPSWRLALAVRNANRPDVGLDSEDRVGRELQAGAAYLVKEHDVRATVDYLHRDDASLAPGERGTPSLGLEKGFEDGKVRFRAGVSLDQFTGGVGLMLGNFGFDYAFVLNRRLLASSAGAHQVGIRYRFGGENTK